MNKNNFPSLNALRVFEAVARLGRFKSAATELGVTQSAVSRQLATLEQQLGVKLIQRDNRVHALTTAGETLAPELHKVFRQLEHIVTYTLHEGEQARRVITLGISHEIYTQWLAAGLDEFKQLYPHLDLRFVQMAEYLARANEEELFAYLLRNEIDALIIFGTANQRNLLSQVLLTLPCSLYFKHPTKSELASSTTPFHPSITEFIQVEHQPLTKNWLQHIEVREQIQPERHTQAQSSLMAATLAPLQKAAIVLPALYHKLAEAQQLTAQVQLKQQLALSVFMRKEDEHELALVAFLQWLEYFSAGYAARYKVKE